MMRRRRRLALLRLALLAVALLTAGEELHPSSVARAAAAAEDDAPATTTTTTGPPPPAPPPADEQAAPAGPPPRRPHRRAPPSPKQGTTNKDPPPPAQEPSRMIAPPPQEPSRMVVPPAAQEPAAGGAGNRTAADLGLGCTTLLVFGDSTVDPGNNNHLQTAARANFLPYGLNFLGGRRPTGRFTDGRLATDMIAERLGIGRTVPGFLDPNLRLLQLRRGVSFASGGSGYDDTTANRLNAVSLSSQLRNLFRYKLLLRTLLGPRRAERVVNRAAFVISTGTNDMLAAYLFANNNNNTASSSIASTAAAAAYENYLIARAANYTQVMSMLGARRFLFVGLPPMGCLPIVRTLTGAGSQTCDARLNQLALSFNSKLIQLLNIISSSRNHNNQQQQIRASYIDAYAVINDATTEPAKFGLSEVSRGCCGSGVIEISQTCRGRRTCGDPTKYLYWDAIHPTQRANQLVADAMMDSIRQLYTTTNND